MQVQLWVNDTQRGESLQTYKVYCQVDRGIRGGAGVTIHSGIKLHNSSGGAIIIGMQQRWPGSQEEDQITQLLPVGSDTWLPALCCSATYLTLQPAGMNVAPCTSLSACHACMLHGALFCRVGSTSCAFMMYSLQQSLSCTGRHCAIQSFYVSPLSRIILFMHIYMSLSRTSSFKSTAC